MINFPNAKINLGLNIVSKRKDGYHNLETIFYPIPIKDALEIIPSKDGKDCFIQEGIKVDSLAEDNLVIKALNLLRQYYGIPPLEIYLLKKIPFGAGIGGGSADAAFMLRLLNETFCLGISNMELAGYARQLGADCPFFIYNRPVFAAGIGELLEDIQLDLSAYYLVLIKPEVHIPTRDAFAMIKPHVPEVSLKKIIELPVHEWKYTMANDFEKSIFPKYPVIGEIKQKLYSKGAIYASMSGSGSSVYGIFEKAACLENDFPGCYVWKESK